MYFYRKKIEKVAILGTGTMGSQIAAHFANVGIDVLLYGIKDDPIGCPKIAIKKLSKLKLDPFFSSASKKLLTPLTYEENLANLSSCDLIIEAIIEDVTAKVSLYDQITPHLKKTAILASNTSGLSFKELSKNLPDELSKQFCGIHFFNPPRYLSLVELIPTKSTAPSTLNLLEGFLTQIIGKRVVIARDTPGFIANRIGIFSIMSTLYHAERLGIPLDTVDALTGTRIGRSKSATCRTADIVGLDIMQHVVEHLHKSTTNDPWQDYFRLPTWLSKLIESGELGQKTKSGIYKKTADGIEVIDPTTGERRLSDTKRISGTVNGILKENGGIAKSLLLLEKSDDPQAQFLWSIHRDVFHFCAYHLGHIASNARDVDLAICNGFGWDSGPFDIWQSANWSAIINAIKADIANKKTLANIPLPNWTENITGAYSAKGAYNPISDAFEAHSTHPVYKRQISTASARNETVKRLDVILETDDFMLSDGGDNISVLSFKTKMNTINSAVIDGINKAIDYAEEKNGALIIWQNNKTFCAGANLYEVLTAVKLGMIDSPATLTSKLKKKAFETLNPNLPKIQNLQDVSSVIKALQDVHMRLKHSKIPTIAAVQGLALGGGCELIVHCNRVVAHHESYIGLVEIGIGILPAGAGTKEMALRAAQHGKTKHLFDYLAQYFEQIAMAKVSTSATQAREFGYLHETDVLIAHPDELFYVAKIQALSMLESDFQAPKDEPFQVAGIGGYANFMAKMVNFHSGGYISDHDFLCAKTTANVLCGGPVESNDYVCAQWILDLERQAICELLHNPLTQNRIEHILKTGKPLRN